MSELEIVDFEGTETAAPSPQLHKLSQRRNAKDKQPDATDYHDVLRVQPHNIEIEEALLACCLMEGANDRVHYLVAAGFTPEHFYKPTNQIVFEGMLNLLKSGATIDEMVLYEHLRQKKQAEEIGGIQAIYNIQDRAASSLQFHYFTRIVEEKKVARTAIREYRLAVERLYEGEDPFEVIASQRKKAEIVEAISNQAIETEIRGIGTFSMIRDDDPMVLLGNKYLNRGHICTLVSTSGRGISSLPIQQSICYALGWPFGGPYGIKPNGPKKSLIVQSEDDDADIGEVAGNARTHHTRSQNRHLFDGFGPGTGALGSGLINYLHGY